MFTLPLPAAAMGMDYGRPTPISLSHPTVLCCGFIEDILDTPIHGAQAKLDVGQDAHKTRCFDSAFLFSRGGRVYW